MADRRPRAVLAAGALGLLAACAGHAPAAHPTASLPTPAMTKSMGGGPSLPRSVPNEVTARARVAMTTCKGDASSWSAGGTASNTTSSPVTYAVTVFFTSPKATVLSSASADVTTPAHKTVAWSAASHFHSGGPIRCVLRGVAMARA
jgi:hypothetical protein